jgi:hypothetical protein
MEDHNMIEQEAEDLALHVKMCAYRYTSLSKKITFIQYVLIGQTAILMVKLFGLKMEFFEIATTALAR